MIKFDDVSCDETEAAYSLASLNLVADNEIITSKVASQFEPNMWRRELAGLTAKFFTSEGPTPIWRATMFRKTIVSFVKKKKLASLADSGIANETRMPSTAVGQGVGADGCGVGFGLIEQALDPRSASFPVAHPVHAYEPGEDAYFPLEQIEHAIRPEAPE